MARPDSALLIQTNGYLKISGFASQSTCSDLRSRLSELIDAFEPSESSSVFTSHENKRDFDDAYFLESGDKIRFFWEEDAFESDGITLAHPKHECINKVGHALHVHDPLFREYCGSLRGVAESIGMSSPVPMQSMYICKSPRTGGEVGPHQDSTFLFTDPPSVHGLWLSVDSSDTHNGCLWVKPGSHTLPVQSRLKRVQSAGDPGRTTLRMEDFDRTVSELPRDGGVPVPTEVGDLIVLHGQLVHWSDENKSGDSRHALMVHVVDGACDWAGENWLQYPEGAPMPTFCTSPSLSKTDI